MNNKIKESDKISYNPAFRKQIDKFINLIENGQREFCIKINDITEEQKEQGLTPFMYFSAFFGSVSVEGFKYEEIEGKPFHFILTEKNKIGF